MSETPLSKADRAIINALQGAFPINERPFAEVADWLGMDEKEVMARIRTMLASGVLTRFGPMYNPDRMGESVALCALEAPQERFDEIAGVVNSFEQVAHNYQRDHKLNMWFVASGDTMESIQAVLRKIETQTGCKVYCFPKEREFCVDLRLDA